MRHEAEAVFTYACIVTALGKGAGPGLNAGVWEAHNIGLPGPVGFQDKVPWDKSNAAFKTYSLSLGDSVLGHAQKEGGRTLNTPEDRVRAQGVQTFSGEVIYKSGSSSVGVDVPVRWWMNSPVGG